MSTNNKKHELFAMNSASVSNSTKNSSHNVLKDHYEDVSTTREINIIENMSNFLEENGGDEVDARILRNMAEALIKRMNNTSAQTLQDVTMDSTYGVGYHYPGVSLQNYQESTSPATQGRSVREYEEQMATLRKENFNLKLRLYFVEESIPGYQNTSEGQETVLRQLIDIKIDNELLRKDAQDKQELLKEAFQAMEKLEKRLKETESKYQEIVDDLNQRIKYLEIEREVPEHNTPVRNFETTDPTKNYGTLHKIHELEAMVALLQEKLRSSQEQLEMLENTIKKQDNTIKEYEDKVKELAFQNAELVESLEAANGDVCSVECRLLHDELYKRKAELADKICMLDEAEEKLVNHTQVREQACRTIQKLLKKIKHQEDELKRLNQQPESSNSNVDNNEITNANAELESTTVSRSLSDTEALNEISRLQKSKFKAIIEKQEQTIRDLKEDVRRKTTDLQALVNKELWEKNREIERLTKLMNCANLDSLIVSSTSSAGNELQQSFSNEEYLKALERNKLLQRKVHVLIQRIETDRSNEALIAQLRKELCEACTNAERSEKWRRECAHVCGIFSNRLEELAGFLNSLLKHKDVLGVLAADRRKAMRKAVEYSLDISKSLNMTLSISGLSVADQSLSQLANLSGILGEVVGAENKTFNSHEDLHSPQSIEVLKAENRALKKELDKRRNVDSKKDRRSLPIPLPENQSESEAWSEPDRNVSLARIGLEDHPPSLVKDLLPSCPDTDSESDKINQSRMSKLRSHERFEQLEQMVAQRDERILEIQSKLVEADNRLKQENLRVIEMTNEMEQLRQRNQDLHADLIEIGMSELCNAEAQNESMLLRQIDMKTCSLKEIQEERDRIVAEARLVEQQTTALKAEIDELKVKHEIALKIASEQEKLKLEQLRSELEKIMHERLDEQERQYNEALVRDWITRSLYEKQKNQLEELQRGYNEARRTIDDLNENERELKLALIEHDKNKRALKKQMDESTLQASKAVLERTKALNEKLQLEKRMWELMQELNDQEHERSIMRRQVEQLQTQITKMTDCAVPAIEIRQNASDVSHSGHTSEEVPATFQHDTAATTTVPVSQCAAPDRLNNSSPDLGIESDAGRVSSAELSHTQFTLLKTMKSTNSKPVKDSPEELGDYADENVKPSKQEQQTTVVGAAPTLPIEHDCAKVEQENAELRRKLIRTKRAFEDTYEKLRLANIKKAQIEKDIKNQILKTHNVLKNVRSNMENEL